MVLSACGESEQQTDTSEPVGETVTYKEYDLEGLSQQDVMGMSGITYNPDGELVIFTSHMPNADSRPPQGGSVNNKRAEKDAQSTAQPNNNDTSKGKPKSSQGDNQRRQRMMSLENWATTISIDIENRKVATGSSILAVPQSEELDEGVTFTTYSNFAYAPDGKLYAVKWDYTGQLSEMREGQSQIKLSLSVVENMGETPVSTQVTDISQFDSEQQLTQVRNIYPFEDNTILITYEGGKTRLYDLNNGVMQKEFDEGVLQNGIYVDGNEIYSLSADGTKIEIIDKDTGNAFSETKIGNGEKIENEVAFTTGDSGEVYMATHKGIYMMEKDASSCELVMPESASQIMDLPSKKITSLHYCGDGNFALLYRDSNAQNQFSNFILKLYVAE